MRWLLVGFLGLLGILAIIGLAIIFITFGVVLLAAALSVL